jgi:hypothetical protein
MLDGSGIQDGGWIRIQESEWDWARMKNSSRNIKIDRRASPPKTTEDDPMMSATTVLDGLRPFPSAGFSTAHRLGNRQFLSSHDLE